MIYKTWTSDIIKREKFTRGKGDLLLGEETMKVEFKNGLWYSEKHCLCSRCAVAKECITATIQRGMCRKRGPMKNNFCGEFKDLGESVQHICICSTRNQLNSDQSTPVAVAMTV